MAAQGIDTLLAQIIANIFQNSAGDITGQTLQDQLVDMIDSLNQGKYNNLLPYKVGQSVIFDDGGTQKLYLCVVATVPGESPATTPASWDLSGGPAGIVLDSIETDITSLKAVTGYADEEQILVNSNNGLYVFDAASIVAGDDDLVVTPDDITEPAPGRWIKSKTLVDTTTTGVLGDLTTVVTTNLVAALNDIAQSGVEIVDNITDLKAITSTRREVKVVIVRFYDEGDEGAASGGVRRILFYKGSDTTDPNWEDLANYQQVEPIVTEEFTTTKEIEGIPDATVYPVGTTLESIITALLTPYIPSAVSGSSLQDTPAGVLFEVGATILINSITIAVTNDSAGDPPLTLNIGGTGYNVAGSVGVNAPPSPPLNVQQTTDAAETWTVTGTDANSDPIAQEEFSIDWYFRHFVGASATELTGSSTDGEATTLIDSLQIDSLEVGKAVSITTTFDFANQSYFTYIAYAAKYGDLEQIIFNNGIDVLEAFIEVAEFNYTNAEGHIEAYKVYISNALGVFNIGDELTIV